MLKNQEVKLVCSIGSLASMLRAEVLHQKFSDKKTFHSEKNAAHNSEQHDVE